VELVETVRDIGVLARAARIARGWSQQDAADAAGVSRRFVNMIEGGQHVNAEVGRVLALLRALDVRITAALPADDPATTPEGPHRDAAGPDEIDLDAYLSTFRTQPRPT
jgi:transcriptional regulator with XRE-family HTH domain